MFDQNFTSISKISLKVGIDVKKMTVLIVVFFKGVEYSWFWLLLEES